MKRYDCVMGRQMTSTGDVYDAPDMEESPDGDYIRHDDADLAALVAAAREACAEYERGAWSNGVLRKDDPAWVIALRSALAAAAPGTTTRGGGEA